MSSPALSRHRATSPSPQPPSPHRSAAPVPRPGDPPPAPPRLTGRYRYDRRSSTWWWSAEMFALQGVPGATQPCTEVLLARQHPDDRARVVAALTRACASAQAFTLRSRVLCPGGGDREVVLVGEPALDAQGSVTAVEGMCVDITDCPPADPVAAQAQELQAEVEQLRTAMSSRAVIEQAKGILMLLTSCSDRVAFDLLTHISSHTHRKVRDVATAITRSAAGSLRLPEDIRAILRDACPPRSSLH
jgi:hypothetical protein